MKTAFLWTAMAAGLCFAVTGFPRTMCAQDDALQEPRSDINRLILTDGSYELISRYEIRGDRVRYFSAERYGWEELPSAMIDWAATIEFAGKDSGKAADRRIATLADADAERRDTEARMPEVAPGIRLPSPPGVYLLDRRQDAAELVLLRQSDADLDRNVKRNILRAVINPVSGSRQTAALAGTRSRVQSRGSAPELFVSVDPEDPWAAYGSSDAGNYLRLVQCAVTREHRVVVNYDRSLFGRASTKVDYVEAMVMPVSEYWVRIVPAEPLPPGEYALVELDVLEELNLFVWDFGVDPGAGPNPGRVTAPSERGEPELMRSGDN